MALPAAVVVRYVPPAMAHSATATDCLSAPLTVNAVPSTRKVLSWKVPSYSRCLIARKTLLSLFHARYFSVVITLT